MREAIGSVVGTVASLLAASCCIVPTLFVVFGVSAGSLSFLNVLEPYRWYFLMVAYVAVGYSLYKLHLKGWVKERLFKKPAVECACEEPSWTRKLSKSLSWVALILLIFATFYPYVLEKIYGG
ncbi:mercuric transporter MerT family protein [Hydrogenivirga sp.]